LIGIRAAYFAGTTGAGAGDDGAFGQQEAAKSEAAMAMMASFRYFIWSGCFGLV
jgi:hypothetical protein